MACGREIHSWAGLLSLMALTPDQRRRRPFAKLVQGPSLEPFDSWTPLLPTSSSPPTRRWLTEVQLRRWLEHSPGFVKPERVDHEPSKTTGGLCKLQYWSLAAKIVNSNGLECAIGSLEPVKTPGLDGVYPILLKKGIGIMLSKSPNCSGQGGIENGT